MILAFFFFVVAFFIPTAATYAFITIVLKVGFLAQAEPWLLAMYAAAFHLAFLLPIAVLSWILRVIAGLDQLLDELDISARGNLIISAILALLNAFAMPSLLTWLQPQAFPPSSPSIFHKPGERVDFTRALSERYLAGNIVATGQNVIFQVTGTEPHSPSFSIGEKLPATTAPGNPYWGNTIRSTGWGPGVNPVRSESVKMSFSLLVPSREVATPTEVKGKFVFEAVYPVKDGPSSFANQQGEAETESISFLVVSNAQAQVYEAATAMRSAMRPMRILSLLFSFVYYVALIFFWTF